MLTVSQNRQLRKNSATVSDQNRWRDTPIPASGASGVQVVKAQLPDLILLYYDIGGALPIHVFADCDVRDLQRCSKWAIMSMLAR